VSDGAARTSAHTGVPDGFRTLLAEAARTGRRPRRAELEAFRQHGAAAAARGMPVRDLVGVHLTVVSGALAELPGIADAASASQVRAATRSVLAVVEQVLSATLDGYADSQLIAARQDGEARRQFVDDLRILSQAAGTALPRLP